MCVLEYAHNYSKEGNMMEFHIGRGTNRGALTVFPVWGTYDGPRGYSLTTANAAFSERRAGGAEVASLTAANPNSSPMLLLEGALLEGGWQNRMLTRSVLVPPRQSLDVEVVCVEQGRWGGASGHRSTGRRASMRVRNVNEQQGNRQGEVWRRVSEYDARFGANATDSFAVHADRAAPQVERLVEGLRPLPGQVGVVIGLGGQPVMLEAFDNPTTLRREFDAIIRAAAFDALDVAPERTPARRAFRFVDRMAQVALDPVAPAGMGVTVGGSSPYATLTGLDWDARLVHLKAANPRHPVNSLVGV